MPSWFGVNALRVLGGQSVKYIDLRPDQSVPFGVGVTDSAARAFGRDRRGDVLFRLRDYGLQGFVEPGIGGFDVRRLSDERRRHDFPLP